MAEPFQITSIILVILRESKFLLVQRSKGDNIFPSYWQNMGGKVEIGENIEGAIKREMEEEVGLTSNSTPVYLHSYSWKKDKNSPTRLGLIFLINLSNKISDYKIKLSKELEDFGWFSLQEAQGLKTIGKRHPTGTLGQLVQAMRVSAKLRKS